MNSLLQTVFNMESRDIVCSVLGLFDSTDINHLWSLCVSKGNTSASESDRMARTRDFMIQLESCRCGGEGINIHVQKFKNNVSGPLCLEIESGK